MARELFSKKTNKKIKLFIDFLFYQFYAFK